MSYYDIAKVFNCSHVAVINAIKGLVLPKEALEEYKNTRADIFASTQAKMIMSITEGDIKAMPPLSRITGAAILYDKERLERGQSTSNVSYYDVTDSLRKLSGDYQAAISRLGYDPAMDVQHDTTIIEAAPIDDTA